jgi:hypothetical protein
MWGVYLGLVDTVLMLIGMALLVMDHRRRVRQDPFASSLEFGTPGIPPRST